MCNGFSTRTSQGGSIAVLRPTEHHTEPERTSSDQEWHLLFSNDDENLHRSGTQVQLRGWRGKQRSSIGGYWVVIHHDGDLSASLQGPPNRLLSDPLFSFLLDENSFSVTQLPQRLDLSVGDAGIIGRRVSVMTSSAKGPLAIAEGIIGWN
ncbi:uncharacterized protein BDR25DRAFT_322115 [Lindgomyces ingoldianus]|uniref:Uncharacterized protein n=1 Tax=Lindgomyces ingoldianus TaxID=673940 RepID=A0ACB6RE63_9PLEO|nr:uncharacterized protein BDR25DRAFT_322115 [Lindgomyces ingoldianus]KAF2476766.1 hypothetical protein BDR25DRAFT_322115 [Lindgomyces ingoldianus]